MSRDTLYQQVRSHLAYLKLAAAAEALSGELDTAIKDNRNHTEFVGFRKRHATRIVARALPQQAFADGPSRTNRTVP